MNNSLKDTIQEKVCHLIGHKWRYVDYSNFIKNNGEKYDFIAARNCIRCNQYSYFYESWQNQEKSILDFVGYCNGCSKEEIDNLIGTNQEMPYKQ